MATKPLIFSEIEIQDSGGTNGSTFDKHLVESAEVTLEAATSEIEDGQSLTDYYDVSFSVGLYDDTVLADSRVYTDASTEPIKANILFKKATGATTLTIEGVIINGNKDFGGNRVQAMLSGSKRAVSIANSIAES